MPLSVINTGKLDQRTHIFKCFSPRPGDNTVSSSYDANGPLIASGDGETPSPTAREALLCCGGKASAAGAPGRLRALIFTLVFLRTRRIPAPAGRQAAPGSFVPLPAAELLPTPARRFSGEPFPPAVALPLSPVMLCSRQTPVGLLNPNKTRRRCGGDRLAGGLWP